MPVLVNSFIYHHYIPQDYLHYSFVEQLSQAKYSMFIDRYYVGNGISSLGDFVVLFGFFSFIISYTFGLFYLAKYWKNKK